LALPRRNLVAASGLRYWLHVFVLPDFNVTRMKNLFMNYLMIGTLFSRVLRLRAIQAPGQIAQADRFMSRRYSNAH
jgi:hypothetical protein